MKLRERWYSGRVESDVTVVRWGHYGRPVIIFPTAGGDAEEIERMLVIDALGELIDAGRIKVYSCDSVAGYAMLRGDGSPGYRAAVLNGFHAFVREEMIPAIWADCMSPGAEVIACGASIGAFNAVAMLCRHPDVVSLAIGMSGTYDVEEWIGPAQQVRPPRLRRGALGEHRPLVAARRGVGGQGHSQPGRLVGTGVRP
jgi:esterase/lipase superfamily enzyme